MLNNEIVYLNREEEIRLLPEEIKRLNETGNVV